MLFLILDSRAPYEGYADNVDIESNYLIGYIHYKIASKYFYSR